MQQLRILKSEFLEPFATMLPAGTEERFNSLEEEKATERFTFYNSVSAVSSSKIEGEAIELDSFLKYKLYNTGIAQELVQKPEDLYNAYVFAQENSLSLKNFLEAHAILSQHLLIKESRGQIRNSEMIILNHNTGTVEYEACRAEIVKKELDKLFEDIDTLIGSDLSFTEILYYAAFIHLAFVKIHPFDDGNGRAGRLLEKWFLAEKAGFKCWQVPAEKMYFDNVKQYYSNLQLTGFFYDSTDYSKALPFLLMLPTAF